ncbi:hypothetical protein P7C70_g7778, partial [Phenoliferia sp. Uapishka_3]
MSLLGLALYTLVTLLVLASLLLARITLIVLGTHNPPIATSPKPKVIAKVQNATIAIFLGSGGHTAEMMRLLDGLNTTRYDARIYIISSGDNLSEAKALQLESRINSGSFDILQIPRARRVLQSYLTSPFTTIYSLIFCLWHISLRPMLLSRGRNERRVFADVILLNGPGSCVPIAFAAFLPRVLGLPSSKLIYVESLARTRRLSVSAKLVRPIMDRFFVQWESLRESLQPSGEKPGKKRWMATVECEGWLV